MGITMVTGLLLASYVLRLIANYIDGLHFRAGVDLSVHIVSNLKNKKELYMLIQDVRPPKIIHINVYGAWSTYYLLDGEWRPF